MLTLFKTDLNLVWQAYYPSTWKAEAKKIWVQGHPQLRLQEILFQNLKQNKQKSDYETAKGIHNLFLSQIPFRKTVTKELGFFSIKISIFYILLDYTTNSGLK